MRASRRSKKAKGIVQREVIRSSLPLVLDEENLAAAKIIICQPLRLQGLLGLAFLDISRRISNQ